MVLLMHYDVSLEDFRYCRVPVLKQPSIRDVESRLGNARLSKEQIDQTVQALERIAV